ncbi:hypothetical protein FRC09_002632 [Ceratobasidium sp. 395]|nr:hypothetical protein FRC09_002632 [Ceratobasidium sp. 395]
MTYTTKSCFLSPTHRADIETWILAVSSHPPNVVMSARSKPPTGENKSKTSRYPLRANKRVRAESSDEEIPEAFRVVVSRNVSLNDPPMSPIRPNTESEEEELANAFSEGTTIAASEASSDAATEDDDDDILEVTRSEIGSTASTKTTKRRNKTIEKRQAMPPEEELVGCIQRIKDSDAEWYKTFELPTVEKVDHPKYNLFECKNCGESVKRRIGYTTTSQLKYHVQGCKGKQTVVLEDYGIFGGSQTPSAYDVRETVALWTAESARPFTIVQDPQFRRLMPPTVRKLLPSRTTISEDVKTIYKEVQNDAKAILKKSRGVLHLALDMCTAPNMADFMGVVVTFIDLVPSRLSYSQLSRYDEEHSGEELSKAVHQVLMKFEIEHRVWAVVCDNASNNAVMMKILGGLGLKRLNGPKARSMCMLHCLNLAAQDAMLEYRKARKRITAAAKEQQMDEDEDEEWDMDPDPNDEDIDPDDDGTVPPALLTFGNENFDDEEELDEIDLPKIVPGSPEAQEADRAYTAVVKIITFGNKIRFSRVAKRVFKAECVKQDISRPHNVRRDNIIRFNSTGQALEDGDRTFPAAASTQKQLGVPYHQQLKKDDQKPIKLLIEVLKPLRIVTEILSRAEVPLIADVIFHFDALNNEYNNMCIDSSKPLYIRHAANNARRKLDKYYSKTDESDMYRLALLLHPSMRVAYLVRAKWEPDWIDAAVKLTEEVWETHYKLTPTTTAETPAAALSDFAYSSWMTRTMTEDADSAEPDTQDSPVRGFVYDKRLWDTSTKPPGLLNPLAWWQGQRTLNNEFNGLTQMALDVLSTPATSVDVERAFSFVNHLVSKRRYRLSPCTIEATASLGSYIKAGLVKPGILATVRAREKADRRAAGKGGQTANNAGPSKPPPVNKSTGRVSK